MALLVNVNCSSSEMNKFTFAATATGAALAAAAFYYYFKKKTKSDISKPDYISRPGYESLIGNTPLIELKVASELTGCRILVKV